MGSGDGSWDVLGVDGGDEWVVVIGEPGRQDTLDRSVVRRA